MGLDFEPSFKQIQAIEDKGVGFARLGLVDFNHWQEVISGFKNGFTSPTFDLTGWYDFFKPKLKHIQALTRELIVVMEKWRAVGSDETKLNEVMNTNQDGDENPKVGYAKLYLSWLDLQQYMLAFSMITTEAHYSENGFGSLIEKVETLQT
jgi:hypothetical protein